MYGPPFALWRFLVYERLEVALSLARKREDPGVNCLRREATCVLPVHFQIAGLKDLKPTGGEKFSYYPAPKLSGRGFVAALLDRAPTRTLGNDKARR